MSVKVDKYYCASEFLQFRCLHDPNYVFNENMKPSIENIDFKRDPVKDSRELYLSLKKYVEEAVADGKAALALSGGIDSAILAKLMPKGSTAYTFRCIVPGKKVIDETDNAAIYAEEAGLKHKIIDITWENVLETLPVLMKNKNAPIHSIEAQIYIAACTAKRDGFTKLIFGENADIIYGGMDGLLKEDWLFGDYVERYSYIMPYKVLRQPYLILWPFQKYEINGHIDAYSFINEFFRQEALGSYNNACNSAGIRFVGPFSKTKLSITLDYARIRSGDTKYIIRELFKEMYDKLEIPSKIPMPRPMNEWLANWSGPKRNEFIENCHLKMTGDQKWLIFILEKFLNLLDKREEG